MTVDGDRAARPRRFGDLLREADIRNFRIDLHRLPGGRLSEFATCDDVGADHAGDMGRLARSERNRARLAACGPMQVPLRGEAGWAGMEEIDDDE